jgi:hypothetical protein
MKVKIKVENEVEIKTLSVKAGVRCWGNAEVNGIADTNGDLIPCRDGDYWCPIIDLETGIIQNWTKGVVADIHYKICDDGSYFLVDSEKDIVLSIENDYVPDIMCPNESNYGDYIRMTILENGQIENWKVIIKDFINEE